MFVFCLGLSEQMFGVGGAHSSTAIECMLRVGLHLHSAHASGPRFMHRVPCRPFCHLRVCLLKIRANVENSGHSVTPHGRGLYLALKVPRGGQGARLVVWLLYNASGWCNWWLVVCGHCVVVLGGSSEIGCLLVVNWMSVEIACVANWLFFLFLYFVRRVCTTLPSPRFGVGF